MGNNKTIVLDDQIISNGLILMEESAKGLNRTLGSLQQRLHSIFNGVTLAQYFADALKASGQLENELLVMRLALGKLRVAIGDAFAPLGQVVIPVLNDAIFATIRFVRSLGKIIRALFGIRDSADDASDAEDSFANSVNSASGAVKRSLASFDKLNRLQQQTGGGGGGGSSSGGYDYSLNLQEYLIFNTIANMLKPLQEIDLTPLTESINAFREAMRPITKQLFDGLRWAWDNIFVPIIRWSAEILLPAVIDTLTVALQALNNIIEACKPALIFLWENFLEPLGKWAGQYLLMQLQALQNRLEGISDWVDIFSIPANGLLVILGGLAGKITPLINVFKLFNLTGGDSNDVIGTLISSLWNLQAPMFGVWGWVGDLIARLLSLGDTWSDVSYTGVGAKDRLVQAWSGIGGWFQTNVFSALLGGFRNTGNGILGIFSGVSGGATNGMNGLIRAINRIQINIPDWVPGFGGKRFGFNIQELTAPNIPYLAKGAVLPANKPFLAVVGDQRHGTNVEAPLSTIQDAVRLELQDMIDSNLAGQEAIAGVLRQILEAVLGISITDGDISAAADRYRSRMAVVRGIY